MLSRNLFVLLLVLSFFQTFPQQETKPFVISKSDFKYLLSNNGLMSEGIKNAFGAPTRQNPYKLDINQADAWTEKITEFQYYPGVNGDNKKTMLSSAMIGAKENTGFKMRISINPAKSEINKNLRAFFDAKGAFTLNVVVLAEKYGYAEATDRNDFLALCAEQGFIERAFVTVFGENPRNANYSIAYDKFTACLGKEIVRPSCNENFELTKNTPDAKFTEKLCSADYSNGFILFDIPINRQRSSLNEAIEQHIFKEANGSEKLKLYFGIPKDNVVKKKKLNNIEGKLLNALRAPLKNAKVYLRDGSNTVIATQITNQEGYFKFEKLNAEGAYSLYIDNTVKESMIYLYSKQDVEIGNFNKTEIGFEFKLMDAVMTQLTEKEETDASAGFLANVQGRIMKVGDKASPVNSEIVELRNASNQVVQTQKTDENGNFEFKKIDSRSAYSIELPHLITAANEKVYLANKNGELMRQFKKEGNKFSFKVLPADISYLADMNETDVTLNFNRQKNNNGKEIVIRDFIYYDLNSAKISAQSKPTLDKIAVLAAQNSDYKLEVISHTDCRGESAENQKLSEKRSEAVVTYLTGKQVASVRMKALGMGESKPMNACVDGVNCIEDEYKMNRRTEFRFYK